jgi:hypothetical protein
MKDRKSDVDIKVFKRNAKKRAQVAISRLKTEYTRATHGPR